MTRNDGYWAGHSCEGPRTLESVDARHELERLPGIPWRFYVDGRGVSDGRMYVKSRKGPMRPATALERRMYLDLRAIWVGQGIPGRYVR